MQRHAALWLVVVASATLYGITAVLVAGRMPLESSAMLATGLASLAWLALARAWLGPRPRVRWHESRGLAPRVVLGGVLAVVVATAGLVGGGRALAVAWLAVAPIAYAVSAITEVWDHQDEPA